MTDNQQRPETTSPISGTSHPRKSNANTSVATDRSANAKAKFIQLLKAYIYQEKGSQIYD